MADGGLFIGWGETVRGRESQALEVFNQTMAYFLGLQADGVIESVEPVFLEPHGGDLGGFFLVRGEPEKLAVLRVDMQFAEMMARAGLVVDGLGVVAASTGERLQAMMGQYAGAISDYA
jgi:hypothetical protein